MYSVQITPHAERDIRRLDRQVRNRVISALMALASDARPPGCSKVRSEPGVWRIRVGDHRVAYEIDDDLQTIRVLRVGARSGFYG